MAEVYKTLKIFRTVTERLNKLRVHRPDLGENIYEKTYSVVIMDLIDEHELKTTAQD